MIDYSNFNATLLLIVYQERLNRYRLARVKALAQRFNWKEHEEVQR